MNQRSLLTAVTVFLAALLTFHFSNAALLKQQAGDQKFEGHTLLKSSTLSEDDKTEVVMQPVSHGLRKKTVFGLVTVNVYVMQLMAAHPEKLVKTEAGFLDSLKDAGPVQLDLTFMRDLSGDKISSSFKEGLQANGVDTAKLGPELTQVLQEISAIKEFKENESFSVTVSWSADKASVYLNSAANSKIVTVTGSPEFAKQLLAIWFGKAADSRLEDLKRTLIK